MDHVRTRSGVSRFQITQSIKPFRHGSFQMRFPLVTVIRYKHHFNVSPRDVFGRGEGGNDYWFPEIICDGAEISLEVIREVQNVYSISSL